MPYHPNGFGQSLGDSLVVEGSPAFTTGKVWYVDSTVGDDSYDGRSDKRPLATLSQAQTNASSGDVVVLMAAHAETYTSALTISKELIVVGGGQSDGKPTVKYTNNQAAGSLFTITADNVELRNIWFEEESQSNSSPTVASSGDAFRVVGCYMELDENTTASGFDLQQAAGETALLRNCTFVSTAAAIGSVPDVAIAKSGAGQLWMDGVTFDGGTYGFEEGYAYDEDGGAAGRLVATGMTLLRGADMRIHGSSTAVVQVSSDSDEPRIDTDGADPA